MVKATPKQFPERVDIGEEATLSYNVESMGGKCDDALFKATVTDAEGNVTPLAVTPGKSTV